jgi:phosphoribulokinase/uridine kinase family protein
VLPPVPRIVELLSARTPSAGGTRVLAVDGPSGSGKTTLANLVGEALGQAPVVHLDDLYPGWDGLADVVPRLVEWVLQPLAEGRPVRYRRYDWERGEYAEWVDVAVGVGSGASTLIVEGVGAGAVPCAPYLSLLVWLDAPTAVRFERGIARDGEGYRPHWQRWAEQENRYLAEHDPRGRADLRLET